MKKVLIAGMSLAMVMGISGIGFAGMPSTDECCGENQARIDNIRTINAINEENINSNTDRISATEEALKAGTPDYFYGAVLGGINFSSGTDFGDVFDDNGWQGGVAFGNRIQEHIRVEGEYQYLDANNKLKVSSLMSNIYYDFGTWSNVTPYVTTGIGIGWFDYTDSHIDEDDHSFVWKIGAGADYAINDKWSVGARYTYFDAVDDIDYDTNQVNAIITMRF